MKLTKDEPHHIEKITRSLHTYVLHGDAKVPVRHNNCLDFKVRKLFDTCTQEEHRPNTAVCCWHDGETFDNASIGLVNRYDSTMDRYYTYGHFCSANCALRYLLEGRNGHANTHQIQWFIKMCRDVYKLTLPIKPANPALRLLKYGGTMDITTFRANHSVIHVHMPPMVAERQVLEGFKDIDGDNENGPTPAPRSMFAEFLESRKRTKKRTLET